MSLHDTIRVCSIMALLVAGQVGLLAVGFAVWPNRKFPRWFNRLQWAITGLVLGLLAVSLWHAPSAPAR